MQTPGRFFATFRFRIIGSFLLTLSLIFIILAVSIEYFLIPQLELAAKQYLVNSTHTLSNAIKASAGLAIKNHLKTIAEKNREIALRHVALVNQGLLSREEAEKRLRVIFLSQKIGSSGYIYCLNTAGHVVVHPNSEVEDTNPTNFAFVREQLARREGYLEYNWQNPGETSPRPKALYMVYCEPLDWIISVSSYKNEFFELVNPLDFRDVVASVGFGTSGYAYMLNRNGAVLLHPELEFGTDLSQNTAISGVVKEMLARKSGILEYEWRNKNDTKPRQKLAAFESVPGFGWVVASSAYLDEILVTAHTIINYGYVLMILAFIFAGIITYLLSCRLSRPIDAMLAQLEINKRRGLNELVPVHSDDELGTLARELNNYIAVISKQSERMRKDTERYESLFAANPDAVLLLRGLEFLDCNPATSTLFEASKEQLIGRSVLELSPEIQANGERSSVLAERMAAASALDSYQMFEWLHATVHGRIFKAEVRLKTFGLEDGAPLLVAFVRDITERKRVEEALRLTQFVFDKASVGIFRSSSDAKILNVNEQACRSLGYSREELCTMTLFDIDPSLTSERWQENKARRSQKSSFSFESTHKTKEGKFFPVQITTDLLKYEGEEYSIAFVRDITEEKKKEQEKQLLEAHFQQARRMESLGALAGGIAHDFNNILSAIIGYAELSRQTSLEDSKIQTYLSQLLMASNRAKNLVQQILNFSRQGKSEKHPIDLAKIIKEALELIRISAPSSVIVTENIQESLGVVLANETQIHQVVMNLCMNACHAMKDSGGNLKLDLLPEFISAEDLSHYPGLHIGPYLKFVVADTGCGIEPEHLLKIFDPYFTTKPTGHGSGLGLSNVHGIVNDHGGIIKVHSEVNRGTSFQVFLPLLTEANAEESQGSESQFPRGNETILFVDDEKFLIDIGNELLTGLGYTVEARASSADAIQTFRTTPMKYDLVITDLTMPGMDGIHLAMKMQEIRPGMPVILCTGYGAGLNPDTLSLAGIRNVLMKPVTFLELAISVRKALDSDAVG